ncbi:MAG: penicillin-binding transpeptidase domain-containing protein [Buchananella hordeovulneris]|nr:penicillin-binding transpeptidase domain-containing protein [Buchananella hordeovulneris]
MNKQILTTARISALLFVVLFAAVSYLQVLVAPELRADPRNVRAIYETYGRERGPILVEGQPIAASVPANDVYKFLRTYSNGPLYAPITGYYSTTFVAATGMEQARSEVLSGTSSSQWFSRIGQLFAGSQPRGGGIELTIDASTQQAAWDALGDKRGAVVAIEPSTGRILALVSKPSFDPNQLALHDRGAVSSAYAALELDKANPLQNRAIAGDLYAPGSTFKIITTSAFLTAGTVKPDTELDAPTELSLPDSNAVLRNYGGEPCGDGRVTLQEAFDQSCNTPFALYAMELGAQAMSEEATRYGLGAELSIPLTVTPSIFPTTASKSEVAMSAIGQFDVRVTPLQMALVAAGIANNGVQMAPYLVQHELNADLQVVETTSPQELRRSSTPEVAAQLRQLMVSEVENGTGSAAALPGVKVGGKTGTAQTGSDAGGPHTWFVGFAPADNPRIAIAVLVEGGEQAEGSDTGGKVAAPIARQVLEAFLD